MQSYAILLCLCLFSAGSVNAFTVPQQSIGSTSVVPSSRNSSKNSRGFSNFTVLNMAPKDPSRSGTKTTRMDKMAEMEKLGTVDEDNSIFVKAAGGFVALIVLAIAAAASSGLLTQY